MCDRCASLQYLLDEMTAVPELVAEVLSPRQRRLVGLMLRNPGKPVSRTALTAALMVDRPTGDWPQEQVIKAMVWKIRRKNLPITIRTWPGYGYSASMT